MEYLSEGLSIAITLIAGGDAAVLSALFVSLQLSLTSTVLSATFALPIGYLLGSRTFAGKRIVQHLLIHLFLAPSPEHTVFTGDTLTHFLQQGIDEVLFELFEEGPHPQFLQVTFLLWVGHVPALDGLGLEAGVFLLEVAKFFEVC